MADPCFAARQPSPQTDPTPAALLVLLEDHLYPLTRVEADGHVNGVAPDLLSLAAHGIGRELRYAVRSPDSTAVQADMVAPLTKSQCERLGLIPVSLNESGKAGLMVNAKLTDVRGFSDLAGLRVGAVAGSQAAELAAPILPFGTVLVDTPDLPRLALLAALGRVDALIAPLEPTAHLLAANQEQTDFRVVPGVELSSPMFVGVRGLELSEKLNRQLSEIWVFDVSCGIHASRSWVMGAPMR